MSKSRRKHTRGKKTFFYLFIRHGWWVVLIGLACIYLAWLMYFGNFHDGMQSFLGAHPDWYISVAMLSEWIALLGAAFIVIAYLEASVIYRNYKFVVDQYAIHLHRGLFFIRETTIPYQQITNVHIERPYHYRMFGIAKLDIVTAADKEVDDMGKKTKKFLIPIIDLSIARKLSRYLLERASKIRSDAHNSSAANSETDTDPVDSDDMEDDADSGDENDENQTE